MTFRFRIPIKLAASISWLIGALLLFAAITKIANLGIYLLDDFPSLPMLSADARVIVALSFLSAEITIGAFAILNPLSKTTLVSSVSICVFFTIISLLRLNDSFEQIIGFGKGCGCFVLQAAKESSDVGRWTVARVALLALAAFIQFLYLRKFSFKDAGAPN